MFGVSRDLAKVNWLSVRFIDIVGSKYRIGISILFPWQPCSFAVYQVGRTTFFR